MTLGPDDVRCWSRVRVPIRSEPVKVRIQNLFVSMQALVIVGSCAIGCDRVFMLERGPSCGDGELLLEEDCDDGDNVAGDGCGTTCTIEPGFECPTTKDTCLPVVGLSRGAVSTRLEVAGSPSGNPFMFECPIDQVVIGFEGFANPVGDNLGILRVVCGSLGIGANGDALLTRSAQSKLIGTQQSGGSLSVQCAPDEVAIGFVPTTNTYLSGFQWTCQRVSHTDGELRFGATRSVSFGPSVGTEESERQCPPGEVVTEASGTVGTSIDGMGLGCSPISTVVCGDGVVAAPETCDDGNLVRRDGCDGSCQRESGVVRNVARERSTPTPTDSTSMP